MLHQLTKFFHSIWYWIAVIATGVLMEGIALFYQYGLGEPPCVLCIQSRFWVLTAMFFAVIGLVTRKYPLGRLLSQAGVIAAVGVLLQRSYTTVQIERGLYEGQCGMDPGFPSWFSLDTWFPQFFEVWTMCGYTPNFLFGLSMGEGLLYGVIALFVVAVIAFGFMIQSVIKSNRM
jgi:disulfide bond formation protein DsbB